MSKAVTSKATSRSSYANGTSTANPHFFNIMNPNTVQAGVWYHVVIVLTSSNAVSYVNGVLTSNAPINNTYTYVPNNNNGGASTGLTIATRGANSTDNTLNWGGAVTEVAYYTNILAASDALADYNARNNKTTYEALIAARHPIFWYKMDEADKSARGEGLRLSGHRRRRLLPERGRRQPRRGRDRRTAALAPSPMPSNRPQPTES